MVCFVTSLLAMTARQTAIVTGAGKRVGACLAEALLGDGWNVVAHVHHADDDVPEGAIKVVADLADPNCADIIFEAADGVVTLLINNAARFAWDGFGEFNADEFDAHMAVNVRAPALLIDRLARAHEKGRDALVVNLLDSKLAAPNHDYLSYTLSKQALAGLTELAARALASQGIRVNGIAPGLMLRSNPKFVLRNHLGQQAIEASQQKDNSGVATLLALLESPFEEHPGADAYAGFPPDWASTIEISCSS